MTAPVKRYDDFPPVTEQSYIVKTSRPLSGSVTIPAGLTLGVRNEDLRPGVFSNTYFPILAADNIRISDIMSEAILVVSSQLVASISAARPTEEAVKMYGRIEVNPRIFGGVPVVSGTRIPVSVILACLADGYSVDDILGEFEGLTAEDVTAALSFAAALSDQSNPPVPTDYAVSPR